MEFDFLYYMKVLALLTVSFVTYRLMILEDKTKTKDHYTRPAWNFFLKKLYAEYVLKKNKKKQLRFVKELRKYENETPKLLPNEGSTDAIKIYGADQDGNSLLIKFIRRKHRIAEIWLILRLKSDQKYETYTLPDHPHTKVPNSHPKLFEASGLKLECLVPYSRWRISYTGMLQKGISQTLSNDEANFHFVKLNFIWTAANNPVFWPYEWNTGLIASALATEKWRDGKWKNLINLNDAGGYDQFGSFKGEVKVFENNYAAYSEGQLPKVENIELNLPGLRHRRWGPHKDENLHRTGVILGSMKDGTVLEIGAFSSKIGVTHSQFGNVRTCTGKVLPIKWTDFHLAALGEYQDQLPQATIVQVEAGNQTFIAVVTFKNHEKVPLFGGYAGEKWNAFVVPIDIVCNCIRGYGVAVFWYPRNIRQFAYDDIPTKIKRIFHRKDVPSPDRQLISFADQEAQSILVAGGKGCSLAILRIIQETKGEELIDHRSRNFQVLNALVDQYSTSTLRKKMISKHVKKNEQQRNERVGSITKLNFPDPNDMDTPDFYVPQGFIISVSAFDEHLKNHNNVQKAIKQLEAVAYEKIDGNLQEICKNVQKAFTSTKLSDNLKAAIKPKLQLINFDSTARFAVRSSGVTEDTEILSAAGQNETFLGLKTNDEVFEAVVKCWSSLFSFQSVLYRKQNILPVASSMAVVIQKMVPAESAGVLFSRHFLNGDPSIVVITANFGLGESVVSAKSEPDTFIIKRSYKGDDVTLLAAIPGNKQFLIEMDDSSSVVETTIDDEKRKKLCLTEDVALKLAKLSTVMEKFFGSPRDIEFAVTKDKRIFLLQSRAITGLNNFTDFEIAHENDSAMMSNWNIYSRGNVGEVLSGAMSRISRSIMTTQMEKIVIGIMGDEPYSDLHTSFFHCFCDTVFIDFYHHSMKSIGDKPTVMNRALATSVFGGDIYEQYPQLIEIANHKNASRSMLNVVLKQLKFFVSCGFFVDRYRKSMPKSLAIMKTKMSQENLDRHKTVSAVFDLIQQQMYDFYVLCDGHTNLSSYSILFNSLIFGVITKGSDNLTTEHQRDVTVILSSIGNIESANVPEMIRDISASIKATNREDEFIGMSNEKCVEWMKINATESYKLFQIFLERHGHRALKEFDFVSLTWSMQPEKIIEMIKANLKIPISTNKVAVQKTTEDDIINQLKTPLTNMSKMILKKIITKSHKGVQYRETAKSQLIEGVNELRRGIRYLGGKMVNEGYLPDKNLIFHLSIQEIQELIKNRETFSINKAVRRQKAYAKHDAMLFNEISFGMPKAMTELNETREIKDGDVIVKGMPVCGGKVTARACVIKHFSEIHKLEKDDILITYCTDIAWSPYFNLISGICTEIGGLISHGAVVARECNLPCIVGAIRATDKIKHGDKIFLNADDGIIVKAN